MSQIIIEDTSLQAILDDPKLAEARRKLSFHEIRLIMNHARGPKSETYQALVDAVELLQMAGFKPKSEHIAIIRKARGEA